MPRRYRGPQRSQIIAYVPPTVKRFIRYKAAEQPNGSETEYISGVLEKAYKTALGVGDPVALFVTHLDDDDAENSDGQDLEGR